MNTSQSNTISPPSVVCERCKTGLCLYVTTGIVGDPQAKVYRCNHCGGDNIVRTYLGAPIEIYDADLDEWRRV